MQREKKSLLEAINEIVAGKQQRHEHPAIATVFEVYLAGLSIEEQRRQIRAAGGTITVGNTFNGFYYKVNGG